MLREIDSEEEHESAVPRRVRSSTARKKEATWVTAYEEAIGFDAEGLKEGIGCMPMETMDGNDGWNVSTDAIDTEEEVNVGSFG